MTAVPPPLWQCLATYWAFTDSESRQLWRGLWAAQWSRASALRRSLLHYELPPVSAAGVDQVQAFVAAVITPARMVQIVEELTKERQISRFLERSVTEKILTRVSKDGEWV